MRHSSLSYIDDLLLRLDFRDPDPEVIDLSPVGGVVSTLQESKIECLSADKVRLMTSTKTTKPYLCAGCLPVLFPFTLPRPITCLLVLD
jgi:hypothetical protein